VSATVLRFANPVPAPIARPNPALRALCLAAVAAALKVRL
jgi:hypothetical protein